MMKRQWVFGWCTIAVVGFAVPTLDAQAFTRKAVTEDSAAANQVWITHPDGAQSCSPKSGQSLEEGAAELKKAHVRVLDSRKGEDGQLHSRMCGAATGSTNAYLIPKDDLSLAVPQGYVQVK